MRKMNLNNFIETDKDDATLRITPHTNKDGIQLPAKYYKSILTKGFAVTVDMIGDVRWNSHIDVDIKCDPTDYIQLVEWWFINAFEDEAFIEILEDTFKGTDNLYEVIELSKQWLINTGAYSVGHDGSYTKRRKTLNNFLQSWLNRNI